MLFESKTWDGMVRKIMDGFDLFVLLIGGLGAFFDHCYGFLFGGGGSCGGGGAEDGFVFWG